MHRFPQLSPEADVIRILQVNKFFHPRAGAETAFLQTRDLLRARGHEVIDFAMRHPDNLSSPYAPFFAPQRSYDPSGSSIERARDAVSSVYSVRSRRALARLLDAHRPDVAHLHNVYHQLTLSVVDELAARRIPIVLTIHDWKIACPAYTLFTEGAPCRRCPTGGVINAVRHRCIKDSAAASLVAASEAALVRRRRTYEKIQRVVSPSRFGLGIAQLAGILPNRAEYIPNFLPDSDLVDACTAVDHGPRLFYAGRLEETKGIRPMLAAFAQVTTPASLHIAGTGKLEHDVRSAAAQNPRIEYFGQLPRTQLQGELDKARAVLLPALYEDNGPFAILEAQAKAKPLIVTDRGGPPEFVQPGETGLVVDPTDTRQLAAAMEYMARDMKGARKMGRLAQARVREEHSAGRHYERLLNAYSNAIAECRAQG
jgi:glycosyltransferase involved in cell wall biosynthesis